MNQQLLTNNIRASITLAFLLFITACDFTPRIHQQILIAQKYITDQEYGKAVKQYHQILKNAPKNDIKIKINYQLGELYSISLGKFEKGIFYYDKIRELTSEPLWIVKTQERIGEIAFTYLKDFKRAIKVYKELSNFRPKLNNIDLYEYRYAYSLVQLNEYKEALDAISIIQKNVNHRFHERSFMLSGTLFFQNKEWAKSISYLREYIKKEKRKDRVLKAKFLLANAYETTEKLKIAYNIYYSILGEYPNTKVIQDRLKSVYQRRVSKRR